MSIISQSAQINYRWVSNMTAGETLAQYDLVYGDTSTGKVKKAKNTGTATEANAIGIVVQSGGIANNESGEILFGGMITNPSWNLTVSGDVFVGSTYGAMTQTQPTSYVKCVGVAASATSVCFNFTQPGWSSGGFFDTSSGHNHDGVNSREVSYANLSNKATEILTGTYSSRPAAGLSGREYIATDTYMPVRCIENGVSWKNYYNGFLCTDPPAASSLSQIRFTLSNSGSASLTDVGDGLLFTQTGNNSTSARDTSMAVTAIPGSGAYSLVVGFQFNVAITSWSYVGLCITDGNGATPKIISYDFTTRTNYVSSAEKTHKLQVTYDNSPTAYSSAPIDSMAVFYAGPIFLKIADDRTNLKFYYSVDGQNFMYTGSLARTAHLTPAYIGVLVGQNGNGNDGGFAYPITETRSSMRIFHWSLG